MADPTWPPLVCTRCGAGLYIEMRDEGSSWQSYLVVDCISCLRCGAEWDRGGQSQETDWLADEPTVKMYVLMGECSATRESWPMKVFSSEAKAQVFAKIGDQFDRGWVHYCVEEIPWSG